MGERQDGRLIAQANETNVLRALHRFGWLRTRDLAGLVWQGWAKSPAKGEPSITPPQASRSDIRMAQRTLARLRERKLILTSQAPNGSLIHAISEKGARALQGLGVPASTGKDLLRDYHAAYFLHRNIANEVAISGILAGYRVASEREISQGRWLGGLEGVLGKKPDVLLRAGSLAWWVEVERSRKNQKDYAKLLEWLDTVWQTSHRLGEAAPLTEQVRLRQVVFICTTAFAKKLAADLQAKGWSPEQLLARVRCETLLYSFEAISFF